MFKLLKTSSAVLLSSSLHAYLLFSVVSYETPIIRSSYSPSSVTVSFNPVVKIALPEEHGPVEKPLLQEKSSSKPAAIKTPQVKQPPAIISGSKGVRTEPRAVGLLKPEYPFICRKRGQQGRVIFDLLVSASGDPGQIRLLESSGVKRLDFAAKTALENSRFVAATLNGKPFAARTSIAFDFKLGRE